MEVAVGLFFLFFLPRMFVMMLVFAVQARHGFGVRATAAGMHMRHSSLA